MSIVVWGIPACGTVKKARSALQGAGIAFTERDLRTAPPTSADVARFVTALGVNALKNTSGGSYRALPLDKDGWSEARWEEAFTADPMLIKRPVIERNGVVVTVGWRSDEALERLR